MLVLHLPFRHGVVSPRLIGSIGIVAVALDFFYLRFGRPRPAATGQQVPRDWGHRFGPWWASVRYGVRMGFGPATILSTWLWWPAFLAATFTGTSNAVIGGSVFAVMRTLTMVLASAGISDGQQMAKRASTIKQWERIARVSSLVVGAVISVAVLAKV